MNTVIVSSLTFAIIANEFVYTAFSGRNGGCRTTSEIFLNGVIFALTIAMCFKFFFGGEIVKYARLISVCTLVHLLIEFSTRARCDGTRTPSHIVFARNTLVYAVLMYSILKFVPAIIEDTSLPKVDDGVCFPFTTERYALQPRIIKLNATSGTDYTVTYLKANDISNEGSIELMYDDNNRNTTFVARDAQYVTINRATNAVDEKRSSSNGSTFTITFYFESDDNRVGLLFVTRTEDETAALHTSLIKANVLSNGVKGMTTPLNADRQPVIREIPDTVFTKDPFIKSGMTADQIARAMDSNRNPALNLTPQQRDDHSSFFKSDYTNQQPVKGFY